MTWSLCCAGWGCAAWVTSPTLAPRDVLTRFGSHGAWLHRLARGEDSRPAVSRRPPLELDQRIVFEPPLETAEPIVFSTRQTAERSVAELARHGLVCTEMRIEVVSEGGWTGARTWAHPRWFTAADLIDRLYWQLQGDPAPEPVSEVRLLPEAVESLADHGEGLWGSALDEHVERGIARLQGMLGPEAVLAPAVAGWSRSAGSAAAQSVGGASRTTTRDPQLPWPGSIPPPAPARVFAEPHPAEVLDEHRRTVVDHGARAAQRSAGADPGRRCRACWSIEAWAGPWPIDELWWDPARARQVARFQMVGVDGSAWLMVVEDGCWWAEARYD